MTKVHRDLVELIEDLERKSYIPVKFRKSQFTDAKRIQYLQYLKSRLRKLVISEEGLN